MHHESSLRPATTEIIARAVVRRDGHLLVARVRTNSWCFLPGGHVEPGERVEDALARELAEELGIEAKTVAFAGAVENSYVEGGAAHHEINLVFEATISHPAPASQEEHLEFHWLSFDQLPESDVRPEALKNAIAAAGDDPTPFWCSST